MQYLIMNKMMLSAVSALSFIGLFAVTAPNVHADVTSEYHGKQDIQIIMHEDNKQKRYQVNGKVFYWDDLSKEQQEKILVVENKLKAVEKDFAVQEKKLDAYAKQLEEKAQAIEDEVSKLERVSVKFEQKTINMQDLHRLADELAKLSKINEAVLEQKEAEMEQIEAKLEAVDLSLVHDIEKHAEELEEVLIEIAKEI